MLSKKILIIATIAIAVLAFTLIKGVSYYKQNSQVSAGVSKTDITLDLDFGNNDGSSTIYDTSGYSRNATSTGSPIFTNNYVEFDGSTDYFLLSSVNVYDTDNVSIVMKFTPDFTPGAGVSKRLFDSTIPNYVFDFYSTGARVYLGGTEVAVIVTATMLPYWKQDEENVLIIRGTSGDTDIWLNGGAIVTNDNTAWTADNPTTISIGCKEDGTILFSGKIHYFKVWQRLLTDNEVANLSADRKIQENVPTESGLIAYWSLDAGDLYGSTVYDKSGNNIHGEGTNIDSTDLIAGVVKQGIDLADSSEYILAPRSMKLKLTEDLTVAFWLKDSSTANDDVIFSIEGSAGEAEADNAVVYLRHMTSHVLSYTHEYGGGANQTNNFAAMGQNRWMHIAVVRDVSANTVKAYMDGEQLGSTYNYTNDPTNTTAVGLIASMAARSNAGNIFAGCLDEIRVYDRAFSEAEVKELYDLTEPKFIYSAPENGLVGWWNMDANNIYGTTVYDKSGYNNNGTMTGGGPGGAPTSTEGKVKQAIDFDGANGYITYNDLDFGSAMTGALWVKFDSGLGAVVYLTATDAGQEEYQLQKQIDNTFRIRVDTSGGDAISDSTTVAVIDTWYHITWTYDGTNLKIYINGELESTDSDGSGSGAISDEDITQYFGIRGGSGNKLDGQIDDVRIYNRALSATEVTQLYESARKTYVK